MSGRFETTRWSLVLLARDGESSAARDALGILCEAYWYPLYSFVRYQGYSADEAADLVQGFFTTLLEKRYLDDVDRRRGRFRSFLLVSLKHFLSNERDRARALKRGGGAPEISLDAGEAEERFRLEPPDSRTPERVFEYRWALTLVDRVTDRLREERGTAGKAEEFRLLRRYLSGERPYPPYKETAGQLGTSPGAVKVAVHRLRVRFGELLREEIAHTVVDPAQVDDEIRYLLETLGDRSDDA